MRCLKFAVTVCLLLGENILFGDSLHFVCDVSIAFSRLNASAGASPPNYEILGGSCFYFASLFTHSSVGAGAAATAVVVNAFLFCFSFIQFMLCERNNERAKAHKWPI